MKLLYPLLILLPVGMPKEILNVNNGSLARCSTTGMALTGWTRSGQCVDENEDSGSHHICIDLKTTTTEKNFCEVTDQPNWCDEKDVCDDNQEEKCERSHWCVCQWAFASYIENAGGCNKIQDVVCEATNMEALKAYEEKQSESSKIAAALACLREKCNL